MTPSLTLIQLISEQTIQNLLPVLRFRPARVVHLVTPKTAARSAHLAAAAHAAGIDPELEVIQLSAMPGIQESFRAVIDCLDEADAADGKPVVNFTGGTKLMSIGAYAAALQRKVPSIYVDTQDACFVDGATSAEMGALLDGDWSFTPIRSQLRVETLAIANGVPRVTAGRPWKAILPLAAHLFSHDSEEQATHDALHGPSGFAPNGREPRKPAEWLRLLDRPIPLPADVATLAVDAGLLRHATGEAVALPDQTRKEILYLASHHVPDYNTRYFKAIAPLQQAIGFLSGGWWEIIVADAMDKSGLVRDLRWSVQVGERSGPDLEEDIVAIDGAELVYVSCKRGGGGARSRLIPLLEEIRSRATTLGGAFNRRFLAVRFPPRGKAAENLRVRSRELGVSLITGDNVNEPGIFSRRPPRPSR